MSLLAAPLLATLLAGQTGAAPASEALAEQISFLPPVFLTFSPQALKKIGSRRAGLLCLPAGPLRGAAVAQPLRRAATAVLQGAIIDAARTDQGVVIAFRGVRQIDAQVRRVHVKACATRWGFGDRNSFKGHAEMRVYWTIGFRDRQRSDAEIETDAVTEPANSSGTLADLVEAALEKNAQQLVRGLATPSSD